MSNIIDVDFSNSSALSGFSSELLALCAASEMWQLCSAGVKGANTMQDQTETLAPQPS